MSAGVILALDMGRRLGVASGAAGARPESYSVELAKPKAGLPAACAGLIGFLDETLRNVRPTLVAKEAPFSLAAFSDHKVSQQVVASAYGLHSIVAGMCHRFGIPCHDVEVSTVTKHFTGKGRWGGRELRKLAIINRARLLGYVPRDCMDEDRCDALAVWSWAAATFARKPGPLALFAPRAA